MHTCVLCFLGYLIGSIPFGFLLSKYFSGIDIRTIGSNSIGTTNVLRTGKKKLALLTLLADAVKGIIAVWLGMKGGENCAFIAGTSSVIGHVFPIWLKFKGGKGAATTAGTFLIFSPIVAIVSAIVWGIVAKITKISSLSSLVFCVFFALITIVRFFIGVVGLKFVVYVFVLTAFLLFTHRANIVRLLKKKENIF
ncbi:MAG: glycerol-3-phosphate 1-O-acyltransferase PlsY [Holosporales bacterium]|jgi:glycerol-3-phosphate acyltransferase PlsY|nr:glycerol-3-phosphate 1-O-acyltransferase PlsY [Holosporales bacterium]